MVKIHLLHKAEIAVLSRSSTLTEVEVEDVVQVKDVVVAVATRIKTSSNNSQMICKDRIIVDGDNPEAGGEVTEILTKIMLKMITENVGVVVG